MHKIECPRCLGGKGEIRAFRHVQGGVCFRCKGRGYVEVKTIPKPSIRFVAMQKWANPEHDNYNNGDFISTFYFKARSQAEATKKLQKKLGASGREFYATPADDVQQ